jgi:4-hydroxy-3-polyprenylbenzoate decarboxylase
MGFMDMRDFIVRLQETGDVVTVSEEVDWDLEAGAIARRVYEEQGPAILFDKIKDYPSGYRLFNGSLGTYRRIAIAMGMDPSTSIKNIQAEYERRTQSPIKPVTIENGPCKENLLKGDEVDLYRFPAPMLHDGDGGRYLGTWDIVVSGEPDSEWLNWGMYRFMIHNKNHLAGFPEPHSHLGMVLQEKYVPKNQPMPVAIAIGCHPLCHMVSTAAFRIREDEADFAGALLQEPVKLVKCETSDLLVPAYSEIVIEGEILPDLTVPEGPFGEYTGFRTGGARPGILCRVKAITYRNNPILSIISVGVPVDDNHTVIGLTYAAAVKRRLKKLGLPVIDVYVPAESAVNMVIVSVGTGEPDLAKKIRDAITLRRVFLSKLIVVDSDVDIFNLGQVLHVFTQQCDPVRGIIVTEYPEGRGNAVAPSSTPEERERLRGALALFDCTWPIEWSKEAEIPIRNSFKYMYPEEVKNRVISKWQDYGFK